MIKLFKRAIDFFKQNTNDADQQYYDIAINAISLYSKGMIKSCSIKLYHDLLIDIDIYKDQLNFALQSKDNLEYKLDKQAPRDIKAMGYDTIGHASGDATELNIYYDRLQVINSRIEIYSDILYHLQTQKDKIQTNLSKCKGLEYQVYYLHTIEGMTLQEIADKLCKTVEHIRKVNSKIGKMLINDL